MTKRNLVAGTVIGILLAAMTLGLVLIARSGSNNTASSAVMSGAVAGAQVDGTVDLNGTWKTTGMTANVTDSTIEVLWTTEDTTGLYWKGTFTATVNDGAKIFSVGDVDLMSEAMLASSDTEKELSYIKGELSFKVTMTGVTKTMRMTRSS